MYKYKMHFCIFNILDIILDIILDS